MGDFNFALDKKGPTTMFCREGRHPGTSRGKQLDYIVCITPADSTLHAMSLEVPNGKRRDFHLEILVEMNGGPKIRSDHALVMTEDEENIFD